MVVITNRILNRRLNNKAILFVSVFIIMVIGLPFTVSAKQKHRNHVRNSSFEKKNRVGNSSFEDQDTTNNSGLAADWQVLGNPYTRLATPDAWDQNHVLQVTANEGAVQHVVLNQTSWNPVRISVRIKGLDIVDDPNDHMGASLDFKIAYHDGTFAFAPLTLKTKNVGTFDWKWVGYNTMSIHPSTQPIDWIDVRPRMGNVGGTAWFDDVHVEEWPPLTNGLVTFMFDDSLLSTFTTAQPMLAASGYVGTEAAVTDYLGADAKHMTLAQLQQLVADGWSVASHTVDHPDLTTLDLLHLNDELYFSQKFLTDNGIMAQHLAEPFGAYNATVIARIQAQRYIGMQYFSARSSDQGLNPQGVFPYNIEVRSVVSSTTIDQINSWLIDAQNQHAWLVLLIHEIDNPNGVFTVSSSMFQNIINAVTMSGLPVMNYDNAFTLMTR